MNKNNQKPNPRVSEIISETLNSNQDMSNEELLELLNQKLKVENLPILFEEDDRVLKIVNEIIDSSKPINDDDFNELLKRELKLQKISDVYNERETFYWFCHCSRHGNIATSRNYSIVARNRLKHIKNIPYPHHAKHIRTYRDSP